MKVHKSIRIEESMVANIEAMAAKELRSFNNQLEYLLMQAINSGKASLSATTEIWSPNITAPAPSLPKKAVAPVRRFVPPTAREVAAYIGYKDYNFDPETFVAHYESNGWKVGRNKMKSWKAACTTWSKRKGESNGKGQSAYQQRVEAGDARSFDIDPDF